MFELLIDQYFQALAESEEKGKALDRLKDEIHDLDLQKNDVLRQISEQDIPDSGIAIVKDDCVVLIQKDGYQRYGIRLNRVARSI